MIDYKNILQEKKKLILSNYTVPQTITQEWISQMFLDNKSTFFIWGWCYRDISSATFSQEVTADTLNKISFDDKTEFPVKLPVGYEPEKLLKETRKEADCQVIDSVEFNKDFICGRFTSADVLNLEYVDLNDWQKEGEWQQTIESRIVIPSAGRALPLWGTEDRYHYCAQSGVSWSIPMLAGLYCLAKQMNPDVEYQEFVRLIKETAYKNKSGLNVINISLLSARLK